MNQELYLLLIYVNFGSEQEQEQLLEMRATIVRHICSCQLLFFLHFAESLILLLLKIWFQRFLLFWKFYPKSKVFIISHTLNCKANVLIGYFSSLICSPFCVQVIDLFVVLVAIVWLVSLGIIFLLDIYLFLNDCTFYVQICLISY